MYGSTVDFAVGWTTDLIGDTVCSMAASDADQFDCGALCSLAIFYTDDFVCGTLCSIVTSDVDA